MDNLLAGLKQLTEFFEKNPKICAAPAFSKNRSALEKVITPLLMQIEQMELEQHPLYAEVETLLFRKKGGKYVFTEAMLKGFARKELQTKVPPKKDKMKFRQEFLHLTAKAGKLAALKTVLDPDKPLREAFIELLRCDMPTIETRVHAMKPGELTRLLEANHIKFTRPKSGKLSKKAYADILAYIQNIKMTELLHQ